MALGDPEPVGGCGQVGGGGGLLLHDQIHEPLATEREGGRGMEQWRNLRGRKALGWKVERKKEGGEGGKKEKELLAHRVQPQKSGN